MERVIAALCAVLAAFPAALAAQGIPVDLVIASTTVEAVHPAPCPPQLNPAP
jgi:hypothetical protein